MLVAMSGDEKGGARRPRVIGRPRVPPGPLADLKALLYELYLQAGTPTLDTIAELVRSGEWVQEDGEVTELTGCPGRDTITRIIGDPAVPASLDDLLAVVTVLAQESRADRGRAAVGRVRDLARDAWVAARMDSARIPAAAIRVHQADPRRLGVHAAISVPGVPDERPPEYVPRDADDGESGIRAKVRVAAQRGGFVLLVGGSSVGKTRCAFEAVTALLPDWWLVHPAGAAEVTALARALPPRTVVWLDELQRYLDGEHGLAGEVVRALLTASDPAVIIGTIWPDRYAAFTAVPASGGPDLRAREREVLDLAEVVRIDPEFSLAEQGRSRAAAARDRRLAVALEAAGYGLTQTLAAAPQLVARWQDAKTADPYAWAVLTAALDAARLGARAPLSPGLLRAAAPGYCTSAQRAEAPENWFEQALAYATGKLHGAAAALSPAGAGMGHIAGYVPADYLIQHASRKRRYERVPASTWDAVISHIRDPADAARLADSARNRLLYRYAIPLYSYAVDAGDGDAARRLADLLARCGDLDGAVHFLRLLADAGDRYAAWRLADLLAERGDLDELRARADTADRSAALKLAGHGDLDGAVQALRLLADADAGDWHAAWRLADLLAERGDLDELRARADAGDEPAAERLVERGDLDELRARAGAGDGCAAGRLAGLLAGHGDLDELRARTEAGDGYAALELARLLAEGGDLDGAAQILRKQADAGDGYAAGRLAGLLAGRGDLDGAAQILRKQADTGDGYAAVELARLLAGHGDLDGAAQILRKQAGANDMYAPLDLADLLAGHGDLDGAAQILRIQVDAGDPGDVYVAERLVDLLASRGDLDELRVRADAGDEHAAERLARVLAGRGDLDELRARTDAGDEHAAERLTELLARQLVAEGQGKEAERLRRFGLNPDGSIASA